MIHQRHRRTDGQTDRRTDDMRSQDRALQHSALRGKNSTRKWCYRTLRPGTPCIGARRRLQGLTRIRAVRPRTIL